MDAIVDILLKSGFGPIKKWVDDMVSFRFPNGRNWPGWSYAYDVEDIFRITEPLGVPWKLGKCFRYASRVVYVGFMWDLQNRTVSLPEKKRMKTLAKLEAFYTKARDGPVSLQATRSITGILSHVMFVYTAGRSYLESFFTFVSSFPESPAYRKPQSPHSLMPALRWWREILQRPGFSRSLTPRSRYDPDVWVDASTSWGIGVIIGNKWAAWRWADGWQRQGRDIFWAEMIALELACLYLEQLGCMNMDIVVHSDNVGVITAFSKGWSKNPQVNLAIGRAGLVCMSCNFTLLPEYVESEKNRADGLSRGVIPRVATRLSSLPSLPTELRKFLISV